jgi:hypothetical protein
MDIAKMIEELRTELAGIEPAILVLSLLLPVVADHASVPWLG